MSSTMSGCSLHQLFILWNTSQPLNSLSTEHCTHSDGFTQSEAVTGTPTTNDYLQLTFPKFRTLEKFTNPYNSSNFQTFKPFKPETRNPEHGTRNPEHCSHSDGFTLSEAVANIQPQFMLNAPDFKQQIHAKIKKMASGMVFSEPYSLIYVLNNCIKCYKIN